MKGYTVIDTHCDTASRAMDLGYDIYKNPLMLDIMRLGKYHHYTQFFAAFIDPEYYCEPKKRCLEIIDFTKNQILKNKDKITLCKSFSDLEKSIKKNSHSAFLSVEGGEAIEDIKTLEELYNLGVRMITLTWNNDNALGGGADGDGRGLSLFGKEVVKKMNALGIIVDISHASEKTFYDVISISKKPVIASHSNAYELCPHQRNLKKEQCKSLIQNGGVCGINFYPVFLSTKKTGTKQDILSHIEYFLSLGGENNICIGSDFDGINDIADGMCDVTSTKDLLDFIKYKGIDEEITEKIAYKNMYRLMSICL